jgi:hypothetical protein
MIIPKKSTDRAEQNLRHAAKSYLYSTFSLYIKLEARVSIWNNDKFGDSANLVCSLNRAIEHLLKLRLYKVDPLLLYTFPKKKEEYCFVKRIEHRNGEPDEALKKIFAHTVSFKEAIGRVAETYSKPFDFGIFYDIYSLRNSLEHHWDRNEDFLQRIVGSLSKRVMPCLEIYIQQVLMESCSDYFAPTQIKEIKKLDRAIERGHSLATQKRFEEHEALFGKDPEACRKKFKFPEKYQKLDEEELKTKCPICEEPLFVKWSIEPDYDVADGEAYVAGCFADFKCVFCLNCNFYVDGQDIYTYIPDDFEIDLADYEDRSWMDED